MTGTNTETADPDMVLIWGVLLMGQYLLVDESGSESDDELDKPIYPPIQYQKKAWF